ncbi:hypothetical protein A3A14_01280 [Candidatus Daviesbacteria bacterium RIFCSPLOWO2_01_FULL_43_38]|nr:MAG: hypothetical protein A2874_02965 [Candidatus Daviesbacteria bacterium RIFCSPHIGHO2_01_FULL_43_17]OGE36863.1 MAG: hypothetical protein A3E45_03405 [Candidatus Daviesbacteria bacterium RIFCSPHIGHO2_12_FULL_43_11]OGE63289.1 MAG: hypothetical protein A3A14_01280 [Candidatus Daviesbacteria bacterium RIFCSPLOWO2_01_FULL_43_38]OGE68953.1 MAG: hypothetical protein A3J21_02465 [Candidatus Daviesbacteria bacterium RIFCSPLOWO2_02_FULL_43_11]
MSALKRFLLPLIFLASLGAVIWQAEPPGNLSAATITQILLFFIPLFLFLTSLINLYTKFLLKSIILGLGLTLLLVLKALDFFIFFSIPAVLIITFLIAKSLKKPARKSFSQKSKIPPKPRLLKMPEMSEARADALKLESPELKKLKLSRVVKQP